MQQNAIGFGCASVATPVSPVAASDGTTRCGVGAFIVCQQRKWGQKWMEKLPDQNYRETGKYVISKAHMVAQCLQG
jgi:hypothetical protein